MRAGKAHRGASHRGFTYVWALVGVALLGIALAAVGPMWADAARREREQELLRIGAIYAQAIAAYYKASPGSEKRYPPDLDALLLDTRFVGTQRHMRRLYPDPMRPLQPWAVVRGPDGTVRGVYSQSTETPFRTEPVDIGVATLPPALRYAEWQFIPSIDDGPTRHP